MPTILFFIPGFPKNKADTNCFPYLQAFLRQYRQTHPEIHIIVIAFHYPFTAQKYTWEGITVYACGGQNARLPLKLWTWWKVLKLVKKINLECKVKLIQSFWLRECAMVGNYCSRQYHIPHICTLMGQDALPTNRYVNWINWKQVQTIAVSPRQAAIFEETTGQKVNYTIPWGVKSEDNDSRIANRHRPIDILGVGNFGANKNYTLFIDIIAEVQKKYPNLQAYLIGEGDFDQALRQKVNALGLQKNLHFLGHLPNAQVLKYMQQSKIFLHPALYEALGYVFLEALQAGMSIVSFPVGIAQESKRWKIATNKAEFIQYLIQLLQTKQEDTPFCPYPVMETVNTYHRIWTLR